MVSSSKMTVAGPPPTCRDRISGLPDDVLGHILSYLPNDEAGRAASLGRRWRDIFGHVHTVSFEETEGERDSDWYTNYIEATERKSCSGALLDGINAALLSRRRCAGGHVPLRAFRFAFDKFMPGWDDFHVDSWLSYVLDYAGKDLHLDLRFAIGPICARDRHATDGRTDDAGSDSDAGNEGPYLLPRRLFSCATLKTLWLAHCRLKLAQAESVHLPALETLRLTSIHHDSGKSIQTLGSSCPRLVDLTIEDIRHLRTLSLLHTRLRRFALRCCHSAKSIRIDASKMASMEYRGGMPPRSLLTLNGSPPQGIPFCTVDLCTPVSKKTKDHAAFRRFLWSFSASKRLHLHHERLHTACLAAAADGLPTFPHMTRLVLQGRVESRGFVAAVRNILERTPNLEVLSLYMAEKEQRHARTTTSDDAERDDDDAVMVDLDEASFSTTCLRLRMREINMVHYDGNEAQRTLARLLFRNAIVIERLCVVFTTERFPVQTGLKKEIESWARAGSQKTFL